jgi:hypothetical protein
MISYPVRTKTGVNLHTPAVHSASHRSHVGAATSPKRRKLNVKETFETSLFNLASIAEAIGNFNTGFDLGRAIVHFSAQSQPCLGTEAT